MSNIKMLGIILLLVGISLIIYNAFEYASASDIYYSSRGSFFRTDRAVAQRFENEMNKHMAFIIFGGILSLVGFILVVKKAKQKE